MNSKSLTDNDAIPGNSRRKKSCWLPVLLALSLPFMVTVSAQAQTRYIGIGIGNEADSSSDRLFANAFMTYRLGSASNPLSGSGPVDAQGYPSSDFGAFLWDGSALPNTQGTYALSFNGQATISGSFVISNQVYNSATNTTTATAVLPSHTSATISFTNTKRTATSATNTGLTNLKLMRPTTYGGTTPYSNTTIFTTPMVNLINKFKAIRFMDFLGTNSNGQVNWSDRRRPTQNQSGPPNNTSQSYGWAGLGASLEYAILLANQTNKDAWINIPVGASDDYITKVAQLFKYGSDGVNPYTTTQTNPVYPPLNSNLKLYVEYSNELWNTAGPFSQGGTNKDKAVAEVNAGGSPLNYDGLVDSGGWSYAWRRIGLKAVLISNIFRGVFGNSDMITRVRPVIETQQGNGQATLELALDMADHMAQVGGHPLPYYIYGAGGSSYYAPDNGSPSLTISNIWTSGWFNNTNWDPALITDSTYATIYGLKRTAYEGGPSMDATGNSEAVKAQAWNDAQMSTLVQNHQQEWEKYGGDIFMYYYSTSNSNDYYQWAFTRDPANLATPKLQGIDALNAGSASAATFGTAIPANIDGRQWNAANPSWSTPGVGSADLLVGATGGGAVSWSGYVIRATSAVGANVSVTYNSTAAATLNILVDGVSVGTVSIPNTGGATQTSAVLPAGTLTAGIHGVRLVATAGGRFTVQKVNITTGGATQVAAPTFSPGGGTYSSAQSVTISSATTGSSIRYTTDGSTPTSASGNVYSGAVSIGSTSTLKAIAYKSGSTDSTVTSATYTINVSNSLPIKINAGGPVVTPFAADNYVTGGTAATNWTGVIDTTGVTGPAPAGVYQSERYGASTYTIPGLTSGTAVKVRLHFCENYFTAANQRKFNVSINGGSVLSDFDIFATAGAIHKAVVREFNTTVNASGQVIIALTNGSVNNALINGVEVVSNAAVPTTVTLNPTDDTDTQSDVAAGTNATLNASMYNTIFARFNFAAVTGTVTSAKFRIYKEGASSGLVCITSQGTTDSWTQSNRSALPGIGSTIQSLTSANTVGYIEFDVTTFVQSRMSGSKLATFAFTTNNSGWYSFTSKEGGNKPQLVITTN